MLEAGAVSAFHGKQRNATKRCGLLPCACQATNSTMHASKALTIVNGAVVSYPEQCNVLILTYTGCHYTKSKLLCLAPLYCEKPATGP